MNHFIITLGLLGFGALLQACGELPETKNNSTMKVWKNLQTCRNMEELAKYENEMIWVEGKLQTFVPWEKGKGKGAMFWEWELVLEDSVKIPVQRADAQLDLEGFSGAQVRMVAKLFSGAIIGGGEEEVQAMEGYRFDVEHVELK